MDEQDSLFEVPEPKTEKVRWYTLNGGGTHISAQELATAEPEVQSEAMRRWFYQNYEDPVHNCPYISSEGGYQYIHGGPYDAREELEQEFSGVGDEDVIEGLANELDDECPNWSGNPDNYSPDLDDYFFRSSAESIAHEEAFRQSAVKKGTWLVPRCRSCRGMRTSGARAAWIRWHLRNHASS